MIAELFSWLRKTTSQLLTKSVSLFGRCIIVKSLETHFLKEIEKISNKVQTIGYTQVKGEHVLKWSEEKSTHLHMTHLSSGDSVVVQAIVPNHWCFVILWLLLEVAGQNVQCCTLLRFNQMLQNLLDCTSQCKWSKIYCKSNPRASHVREMGYSSMAMAVIWSQSNRRLLSY